MRATFAPSTFDRDLRRNVRRRSCRSYRASHADQAGWRRARDDARLHPDPGRRRESRVVHRRGFRAAACRGPRVTGNGTAPAFPSPTAVNTRHSPLLQGVHPHFAGSLIDGCFMPDPRSLVTGPRIVLWIHGHTHDSSNYRCRCTRVLCSPRGQVQHGLAQNAVFDPGLVIDTDTPQTRAWRPTS